MSRHAVTASTGGVMGDDPCVVWTEPPAYRADEDGPFGDEHGEHVVGVADVAAGDRESSSRNGGEGDRASEADGHSESGYVLPREDSGRRRDHGLLRRGRFVSSRARLFRSCCSRSRAKRGGLPRLTLHRRSAPRATDALTGGPQPSARW